MSGFLNFIASLSTTLTFSITFGTVILFGALGEILTEKGGNLNLGVPGIMYIGAIASLAGSLWFQKTGIGASMGGFYPILCVLVCLFFAFAASMLVAVPIWSPRTSLEEQPITKMEPSLRPAASSISVTACFAWSFIIE